MRVIGYTRVSTRNQAGPAKTSLEWQRDQINAYAAREGAVVEEIFTDIASGARLENLTWLQRLIEHCEAYPADGDGRVVVAQHDRLGRFEDLNDFRDIHKRLKDAGWEFTALDAARKQPYAHNALAALLEAVGETAPARLYRVRHLLAVYEHDTNGLAAFVEYALERAVDALPPVDAKADHE